MAYYARGSRVEIANRKHKHAGKRGKVTDLNRGNVTVKLDDGTEVVTRMSSLSEITPTYRVTESPFAADYEDDNPPPWDYDEDGFISWVEEVFFEFYKRAAVTLTAEEYIERLRLLGYKVEVLR